MEGMEVMEEEGIWRLHKSEGVFIVRTLTEGDKTKLSVV